MARKIISHDHNFSFAFVSIATSVAIGAALVLEQGLAWILLAGALVLALLQFPPYMLASGAVVTVVFSRLWVAWGLAPGFVNFLHFPLALGAAVLAMVTPNRRPIRVLRRMGLGIASLGLLAFVSWISNGGEFLRPVLVWLLFAEPFLIIYAIARTTPFEKYPLLARLAIGLAIVQIPFAYWQASTSGLSDPVQGTFIGQGAGAHVAGAIALLGVIVLLAESLYEARPIPPRRLIIMVLLFAVPVLADAKQTIVAFLPSIGFLLLGQGKPRLRMLLIGLGIFLLVLAAGIAYKPLRMAADMDLILGGLAGKVLGYEVVLERISRTPLGLLYGIGPGNSVSRAALAAQDGYIRSIPSGLVDVRLSATTARIISATAGYYLFAASSVWSGISSWLGLFGDLGLAGVFIYLWALWWVWRGLRQAASFWPYAARAALAMGVILGAVFSWLETPEFTLPWALYVATGLVARRYEDSYGA